MKKYCAIRSLHWEEIEYNKYHLHISVKLFSPHSYVQRGRPAAVPALSAASGWGDCGSDQDGQGFSRERRPHG